MCLEMFKDKYFIPSLKVKKDQQDWIKDQVAQTHFMDVSVAGRSPSAFCDAAHFCWRKNMSKTVDDVVACHVTVLRL